MKHQNVMKIRRKKAASNENRNTAAPQHNENEASHQNEASRQNEASHQNEASRHRGHRNKRLAKYCAGILVFGLLVVSALWLPQAFFEFSDALMYGEVSLMEQEKPDVLTLTTGYEESIYRRLAGFAEGLAGQRQYYVDEQPKELTGDMVELLYDSVLHYYNYGIYADIIVGFFLQSLGFDPDMLNEFGVYQWNQYVIYSDDYTKGVNFILWCFTLRNSFDDELIILMDAHDYTVYAIQITGGTKRSALDVDTVNVNGAAYEEYFQFGVLAVTDIYYLHEMLYMQGDAWMTLSSYYEIFSRDELERFFSEAGEIYEIWSQNQPETIAGVLQDSAGNEVDVYIDLDSGVPYGSDGEKWYGIEDGSLRYCNLPVGGNKITFDIYSFGEFYDAGQTINATMGIREIYELIPEFRHLK